MKDFLFTWITLTSILAFLILCSVGYLYLVTLALELSEVLGGILLFIPFSLLFAAIVHEGP